MKKSLIFSAILCICLVAAAGCAGTDSTPATATPTSVAQTPAPTAAVTAVAAPSSEATVEGAVILGQIHANAMEAIEEAFAYVLSGETVEKENSRQNSENVKTLILQFEGISDPDNTWLVAFNSDVLPFIERADASVLAMFDDYEKDGVASAASVEQFEADIDALTGAFGPFTVKYFDEVSEEQFGDDGHAKAAIDLLVMHKEMLNAIEESLGAVVLNDPNEQADFEASMEAFTGKATAFEADAYLSQDENSQTAQEFAAMMGAFSDYEAAAAKFFADFDATGTVAPADFTAYETAIDKLTSTYDTLLETVLEKL